MERHHRHDLLAAAGHRLARHVGFDEAGTHGVHADADVGVFDGGGLRQADDAMLGRNVARRGGKADQSGDRGGVDDRPALLLGHDFQFGFHRQPHAFQIDRDHAVERLLRPFVRTLAGRIHLVRRDAGIVEGAIQTTEHRQHAFDHGVNICRLGYIAADRDRLTTARGDARSRLSGAVLGQVGYDDPRALVGEQRCYGAANATRTAGDECCLAFEHACHKSLLLS